MASPPAQGTKEIYNLNSTRHISPICERLQPRSKVHQKQVSGFQGLGGSYGAFAHPHPAIGSLQATNFFSLPARHRSHSQHLMSRTAGNHAEHRLRDLCVAQNAILFSKYLYSHQPHRVRPATGPKEHLVRNVEAICYFSFWPTA
jgi:hypothetical protein